MENWLTKMDGESSPLNWRRVKVSVLNMQVSRADSLGAKTVEQGYFGAARNTDY